MVYVYLMENLVSFVLLVRCCIGIYLVGISRFDSIAVESFVI